MWILHTVPQFYSKIEIENPAVKDNKEHVYFLKMQSKDSLRQDSVDNIQHIDIN